MEAATTSTISKIVVSLREWMTRQATSGFLAFFLRVAPVPASRPRVSRWGTYYGKPYQKFIKEAQPLADAFEGVPTDRPVMVLMETIVKKPKTGKLAYPRGDVDNFAKGPLDVMTKAECFWGDDNQVVGLMVFKRYAKPDEEAGVLVEWFELPTE